MTENKENPRSVVILVADDDADDRFLMQEALRENRLANNINFVQNGEELLDYLFRRGAFASPESSPTPGLILLDLNMPKLDGREALKEIKSNSALRHIPVVVLTTSKAEEDIFKTYQLGVNSFISKPVTFDGLVKITRDLGKYWLNLVELPAVHSRKED
jgi:CheY-like chemotaxis protein